MDVYAEMHGWGKKTKENLKKISTLGMGKLQFQE